jgi:sterol desaturase/sphingolipid hydroxylase (fatty acid hydroxylase superfamily)
MRIDTQKSQALSTTSKDTSTTSYLVEWALVEGCIIHFGPTVFFLALALIWNVDPFFAFLIAGAVTAPSMMWFESKRSLATLPPYSWADIYGFFIDSIVYGLVAGVITVVGVFTFLRWIYPTSTSYGYLAAFVLTDLSYYLIHRFGYHRRYLIKIHTVHHQVPHLDLLRGNTGSLIDQGILSFPLPLAFWGWVVGANLHQLLIIYSIILMMQTSHHLNAPAEIGWLRWIFMDSHPHKMHHCIGGNSVNFGVVLSIWDHLFDTYYEEKDNCPNSIHERREIIKRNN